MKFFSGDSPSSILFGMSSLVGLVFTTVYTTVSLYSSQDLNLGAITVIVTLAIVNAILSFLLYIQSKGYYYFVNKNSNSDIQIVKFERAISDLEKKHRVEKEKINEIGYIYHNILDQVRNKMALTLELYEEILFTGEAPKAEKAVDMIRINKSLGIYIVNNIKDLFDILTRDNCSVAIKLLEGVENKDDKQVSTFIRDTRSYRDRNGRSLKEFLWYENSAFRCILTGEGSTSYFACDDLAGETGYINTNQFWQGYYNATLVAPIRLGNVKSYETKLDDSIIGFICIDNFKGNLNNRTSIELISGLVDSLYLYFYYHDKLISLITDINTGNKEQIDAL